MSPSDESRAALVGLGERFCKLYGESARFREDKQLIDTLASDVEAVLLALVDGCRQQPADLHDGYTLLSRLCQRAAELAATASVVIVLPTAIVQALREHGIQLEPTHERELAIVAAEGFFQGQEERTTRELRRDAADSQIAIPLGPRCRAIFLAGRHREADLSPVLERLARDLLREDVVSCLLDVSRLEPIHEELARLVGHFCAQAATLGVRTVLVSTHPELRAWFQNWALNGPSTVFAETYDRAQSLVLAAAGLEVRPQKRWTRLFLPARLGLVR